MKLRESSYIIQIAEMVCPWLFSFRGFQLIYEIYCTRCGHLTPDKQLYRIQHWIMKLSTPNCLPTSSNLFLSPPTCNIDLRSYWQDGEKHLSYPTTKAVGKMSFLSHLVVYVSSLKGILRIGSKCPVKLALRHVSWTQSRNYVGPCVWRDGLLLGETAENAANASRNSM